MHYNIRDNNGNRIQGTRISTHTFVDHPENLHLGQHVFLGHFNFLEASHGLFIEEGVQITSHCVLTTHSSHLSIRLYGPHYADTDMHGYYTGEIHIGKYTFVGPHSTLMPRTNLGKGCLVHAYSYVKGTFPDFSILSGNPAVVIGDTRELDKVYLENNPELKKHYEAWAAQ